MTSPSGLVLLEIKLRHVLEESPSGKPTSIWKFPCVSLGKLARNDGVSIYVVFSIHGDTPRNGWFRMENPIKMDDLEVPPFQDTCISWLTGCYCKDLQPGSFRINRLVDLVSHKRMVSHTTI